MNATANSKEFYKRFTQYNIPSDNYDCSEIAEDLYNIAKSLGLKGSIVRLKNNHDRFGLVTVIECDEPVPFEYHDIFLLDGNVYDPRFSKKREKVKQNKYYELVEQINTNIIDFEVLE